MDILYSDASFGIEMEYTMLSREQSMRVLANYFGGRFAHLGGSYDTYAAYDSQGREWKVMSDASIDAEYRNGTHAPRAYQCELVTPVLSFADMPLLMEVIRQLRHAGAKSNSSCGFHVHLSFPTQYNVKQLQNLIFMVHSKQDLLYEALRVLPSRMHYCQKLPESLCTELKRKKPKSIDELAHIYYDCLGSSYQSRGIHYNSARYFCLNCHNLLSGRLNAIEFRCANGSLKDARQVRATIELFALMVAHSFNVKSCSYKRTVPTGSHKYAMRVWMLAMNCKGDALAMCRKYILQHLDGNIAWRDRQ